MRTVLTGRTAESDVPTTIEATDTHHGHERLGPGSAERAAVGCARPAPVRKPRKPLSWKSILVAALAAFGIAAVSLTAIELISGHAPSGGEGTTITQVSEPRQAPERRRSRAGTATKSAIADRGAEQHRRAPEPSRRRPPATAPSARAKRDDQSADAVRLGHPDGEPDPTETAVGRAQC